MSLETRGHVAWVWLRRPERFNAFHEDMWTRFDEVWEEISQTTGIRVVVLAGEGAHFCSGIDLSMLENLHHLASSAEGCPAARRERLLADIRRLQRIVSAVAECRCPVIAAISGACVGGGLDIAAACDLRLATEDAWFSLKEIDVAITADLGSLQRLPSIIGEGRTKEMAFTARKVRAGEAAAWGLVNATYPTAEALLTAAGALAEEIAAKAPRAMRGTKATMDFSRHRTPAEGLEMVAMWNASFFSSDELVVALTAAREKKVPLFP